MAASSDSAISVAPGENERIRCEHAERCAGCPMIGLPYAEQLARKRSRVVESIARYPSLELVYTHPVAAAPSVVAYRTRAKLIVAPGAKLGLYATGGGHHVVDIPRCRVLSPALAGVAGVLRTRILESEATAGPLAPHDPSGRGCLRAVDLREVRDGDTTRVLVTLVVQRARVASQETFRRLARALIDEVPEIAGVALSFHEGETPQVLGTETVVLAGVAALPDRIGNSVHLASFGSFVQAHRGQAARVHALLADALDLGKQRAHDSAKRVLDLYGGSGAIGLGLAAAGARVRLVESFAPSVEQARAGARNQGLDVEAECADAATALRAMVGRGERFDAAVVNPPRRGMSPPAREWICRLKPQLIAYVSCDPETLARDLDHFGRLGYAAASLRPLDMIPLTEEVETLAVLRPGVVPPPRVLFEDHEILVVDKSPHEPTAPQGEYAGSLLARVRRLDGAAAAVPIQRLDVGTSGLVTFARRQELVAKWEPVLACARARRIYVASVRGIAPGKGAITRDLRDEGKLLSARTRYRRLAIAGGHSILRVVPEQERPHQIRRHLASIGHAVLGDARYGHEQTNRYFEEKNGLDRPFLHCVRLEFEPPGQGGRRIVEAPLPGDLRAVLERISGEGTLRFLEHKNALGPTGTSNLPPGPDEVVHERRTPLDADLVRAESSGTELVRDGNGDDDY
jgi:23S rRNA (uracil1939-C5)-methyltransferase